MIINKDNFHEKIKKLKCSNCGTIHPEFFLNKDESPLCESCVFEIIKDKCNELYEINDLNDENEDDVEVVNKLWKEQEHHQKK